MANIKYGGFARAWTLELVLVIKVYSSKESYTSAQAYALPDYQ